MAWRKTRRSSPTGPRPSSSGGCRRPPQKHVDQDIVRIIEQSALRVRVKLELGAVDDTAEPLCQVLTMFEGAFEARRGDAVTARHNVSVQLLECGVNKWQDLVELQRVLAALKRPTESGEELQLMGKTALCRGSTRDEWTLSLGFAIASEDALWRFASSLMLRLRSYGVMTKVVLPVEGLTLLMESAFLDEENTELDKYEWEGKQVWHQVVLSVADEQREEIQRVVLPPVREVSSNASDALTKLRYPELVTIMDDILSSSRGARQCAVVVLRGIPGSGKSSLGHEIKTICSHRRVAFTVCSADFFFETPRGYAFDAKKLGDAHGKCKEDFLRAVRGALTGNTRSELPTRHVVLVDNTNTQRWEYEAYESIAKTYGCRVQVIEIKCPDALTAFRMSQRNSHGVQADKVVSMFLRWEEDSRAHCLTPQFEHSVLAVNPLSDGNVAPVAYVGLFLDADSQKKLTARIPTAHTKKAVEHMTLFYQPNVQYVRDAELGAVFNVRGVEVVQNERGQTLRVEVDDRLPLQVKNDIPHITMSTSKGVRPAYSNDLLICPTASRTAIDPPIDLRARVGAALYIRAQKVLVTTSPFAVDEVDANTNVSASSELFVLHVRECDLVNGAEDAAMRLLKRAQILHHMGSKWKARRLLCIVKSENSPPVSSSALLDKVRAHFCFSLAPLFDDVVVIPPPFSFEEFDESILKLLEMADLGLAKEVTMLTSAEESMRWPLCEMKSVHGAAMSVICVGSGFSSRAMRPNSMLNSSCSTLCSVLDLLGINIEEQARSIIYSGINTVNDAWARVLGTEVTHSLQRVDTTLIGLPSSVIDLCLVLPNGTSLSEVPTLRMKLLSELDGTRNVRHAVDGPSVPNVIYFNLWTASYYAPVFCVRMTTRSRDVGSAVDSDAVVQLELCEDQLWPSRKRYDTESYTVLTALLRGILLSRCSSLLPSKCQLSSLINLISERLIVQYLGTLDLSGEVDAMPTAADVASGRIIFALYRILMYLSKLKLEEWSAAFGTSLEALQGGQNARTAWSQAMEMMGRDCTIVMASYRCVEEGMKKKTRLNLWDHVGVLVALMTANVDVAVGASSVRAFVDVPSHVEWSQVHSFVLCDKLQHAMVAMPQDDDAHNADNLKICSCAPSLLIGRINVTASSFEELCNVMTKMDHKSEEGPSLYVIHRAETDEEVFGA